MGIGPTFEEERVWVVITVLIYCILRKSRGRGKCQLKDKNVINDCY